MSHSLSKGDKVAWTWGDAKAEGKVRQKFTRRVSRTIKGTKVIRNASEAEPAYLIVQEDGGRVLKSSSEITRAD